MTRKKEENTSVVERVLIRTYKHESVWRDRPEAYWLNRVIRLCSDVGLCAVYHGWKSKSIDLYLEMLASIAINWLDYRRRSKKSEACKTRVFRRKVKN